MMSKRNSTGASNTLFNYFTKTPPATKKPKKSDDEPKLNNLNKFEENKITEKKKRERQPTASPEVNKQNSDSEEEVRIAPAKKRKRIRINPVDSDDSDTENKADNIEKPKEKISIEKKLHDSFKYEANQSPKSSKQTKAKPETPKSSKQTKAHPTNENTQQLKKCWERNTRNAKAAVTDLKGAAVKKEMLLTEEGRPNLSPHGLDHQGQVKIPLDSTLDGLESAFDSDAGFGEQAANLSYDKELVGEFQTLDNEVAGPSGMCESGKLRDKCLKLIPENEFSARLPEISQSQIPKEDESTNLVLADTPKKVYTLVTKKKESPSWLQRKRPKTSVHDKLLHSILELVEVVKKNVEAEADIKQLILLEQLKQEKIKSETLDIQLEKLKK